MNETDARLLKEKLSRLSPEQRAQIALRLAARRQQGESQPSPSFPEVRPDPENRYQPFALNDIQQAYLIGRSEGVELGNISCHTYNEVDVEDWDAERFEAALRKLIERHEMLRCIVLPDGRQQILRETPSYRVEVDDLRSLDPAAAAARLEETRARLSHAMHPVDRWPLFEFRLSRLDPRRSRLHVSMDLLIADGRSFEILFAELMRIYRDPEAVLPPLEISFRDYLSALNSLEHTRSFHDSRQYWLARLPTLPPSPELPLAKHPASVERPAYKRRSARLDAAVWRALKEKAAARGLTPPGVLLAAYAEILALWSKTARFTLNLTLFNRLPLHKQANDIVGDSTSINLLEVDNAAPDSFAIRAGRQKEKLWQDLDHRYFSGIRVMRELARFQGIGPRAMMPVVFTSLMNLDDRAEGTAWPFRLGEPVYAITQTPQVYLDFMVQEDRGTLILNWDSVDELFPEGLIDDMFGALRLLLQDLEAEPAAWERTLAENALRLLPPAQREARRRANATQAPLTENLLHTGFLGQVAKRPTQTALCTPTMRLSYTELYARACEVEQELLRRGVEPNQLVAVLMEKGWEQVVAVLGVHFAGGAYLPVDSDLPEERQRYLIEHGNAKVVLTQAALLQSPGIPAGVDRLAVDLLPPQEAGAPVPRQRQKPEDLAYVIYTSGSTGLPKGVMIDHRGAVNTVLDINRRFRVGPDDRVLALSRLNFDLSVYDIFGLLTAGGTIVMPAADSTLDAGHWARLVAEEKVTLWNTVPALMQLLVEQAEKTKGRGESLRLVMMSGDWIPVPLPGHIRQAFPRAEIVSLGGATEASIWSILYPIENVNPNWKSVPYGKPMLNQTFHVLSSGLAPCPVWVPGQLYIGGIGLARGYWRDEQKTAASFLVHPTTGERLYSTGDLGRYLPDGNIEFLGREDFQVKVHGHRIELGEIEYHLLECAGVENCTVTVREDKPGEKRLVGYVVAKPGVDLEAADLRERLRSKVPGYMVPSTIVSLDRLPLSPNGKVNRKALPAPTSGGAETVGGAAGPRDPVELRLTQLWEELLETRPIGIQDNFFDLGGSSLLAVRLFAQIETRFGKKIPLSALFRTPTIESLASLLREDTEPAVWTSLVPVRTSGSRPALFFVHGHMGNALFYRDLAARLGPDQPFYAFQARGLTGREAHHTIEEMARDYIEEMRTVQPRGPYYIGGYCFGGRVALEMAQQLRARGEEVSLLAVLALYEPPKPPAASLSPWQRLLNAFTTNEPFGERVQFHFARFRRLGPGTRLAYLMERTRNASANAGGRLKQAAWLAIYRYYTRAGQRLPRRLQKVPALDLTAALVYRSRYYPGRVTFLLHGEVPQDFSPNPQSGWLGYRADEFEVHVVLRTKEDMFKEPFAAGLAETLAACVDRACTARTLSPARHYEAEPALAARADSERKPVPLPG